MDDHKGEESQPEKDQQKDLQHHQPSILLVNRLWLLKTKAKHQFGWEIPHPDGQEIREPQSPEGTAA
jgi:hypothetical protein